MVAIELDEIITRFQGRSRDALLPVLWEIQTAVRVTFRRRRCRVFLIFCVFPKPIFTA